MSDKEAPAEPEKKGKKKLMLIAAAVLVLAGGGVGGGIYAAKAGLLGDSGSETRTASGPRLVPKSEQVRVGGGEGGSGGSKPPAGTGGDKYASTYYALEKEFTSNLNESVHFIQVGIAISTPYDNSVIDNLKTHEMAVRSQVLLTLGETTEDEVFTAAGKEKLANRLTVAINDVLKQKEGFGGVGNVYFTNFIVQ